jgi:predicted membrane chloride channel (bestrophin family)
LSGGANAAFTFQAYLLICPAVHTIRITDTSHWTTAIIYHTIAIVIFAIADLGLAIIGGFGAITKWVAFEIFAHSVRFI